ncbi:25S rRNA (adenine645-N1)-methyltransferase [Gnomoniopsis sp. IMI 355080]|nr:25S rRNA (adenine645-N1)-methyltransferase [Gnomoniopsis sp. IMI 355080]
MFAVKGWSVSADKLKAEVPKAPTANADATKKSKKRKRQAQNVDPSNVADLWESVIDGQDGGAPEAKADGQPKEKKAKKENKRHKRNADPDSTEDGAESTKEKTGQEAGHSHGEKKVSLKDKKKAKKAKDKQKAQEDNDTPAKEDGSSTAVKPSKGSNSIPSVPPAQPKLTPLQASMREKLISARFRHLNETLYTRPSADALSLFNDSPEMFTEYHEGFRRQVEVWPENPVEGYIADIRARARARYPSKHHRKAAEKQQQQQQQSGESAADKVLEPLPRNRDSNLCTIADLGCGDARLAAELAKDKSKLKVEILSFDLSSPQPYVTKADIANLPLANGTVDVAIFCLALMGTNWVDFIEEAYRILRWKGELWVAEIKSRFGAPSGAGGKKVVEHSVGNRRNKAAAGPAGKKAAGKDKGAADETTLLVEVDGVDDTRQQTDVSTFVKVLNARGFMLAGQDQGRGEEAVDLSNRMFVKMRFIKCAPATKGKCVRKEEAEKSRFGGKLQTMAKKPKFIENEVEVDETSVLKPCVYKLR